ncbi:MAG: MarR family transcriptional regulator [Actinomycetota bacterium]|nr:MarR family transcriptional regulator [Actinomycetota bacterium]MDQ2958144.1 MarR family transcriptional regulator [Actinomycetota bacterium]
MTADRAEHVWQAMRTLMFDVHAGRQEISEALGMSFIRAKALLKLQSGPLSMRELAATLAIDSPYTSVVVDDLERRGLVERSMHPDDRRVKIVSITAAGAESAEVAEKIQNRPPAAFASLAPADLATLDRILTALVTGP